MYKKGKTWVHSFYHDGKKHIIYTGETNKSRAMQAAQRMQFEIINELSLKPELIKAIKFEELIDEYVSYAQSIKRGFEKSEKYRYKHFSQFFAGRTVSSVTSHDVEKYRIERLNQVRPCTVNREMNILSNIFTKAIEWNWSSENPCQSIKRLEDKQESQRWSYITPEQYKELVSAAPSPLKEKIILTVSTGLRLGDINALTWDQIDLENEVIKLVVRKNGKENFVGINKTLQAILQQMKAQSGNKQLFTIIENRKSWKTALRKAGLPEHLRLTDLRHTFASWLAMKDVSLENISNLMGHHSTKMTRRYAHLSSHYKKTAVGKIDEMINGE